MNIALTYYRNGSDWWRLRKAFQKHLSKVQCIKRYVDSTNTVVGEFIDRRIKCVEQRDDFGPELSRLFLECKFLFITKTCMVKYINEIVYYYYH